MMVLVQAAIKKYHKCLMYFVAEESHAALESKKKKEEEERGERVEYSKKDIDRSIKEREREESIC